MKFEKGQSGNPSGRPQGAKNKSSVELKLSIQEAVNWDAIIQKLSELAQEGNLRAVEILLSYGFGKPMSQEEVYSFDNRVRSDKQFDFLTR